MGAPEGEGGGGGDESSSIAHMLRHPSVRQCYFEMKTNKEPYFSNLSSIILCLDHVEKITKSKTGCHLVAAGAKPVM